MAVKEKEKILDRIRKLLALARDQRGSTEEAAVAAAAAQRLMLQHQIEETDLDSGDRIDLYGHLVEEGRKEAGRRWPPWKLRLATAVAYHSSVRVVMIDDGMRLFGHRADCEIAQVLFQYLTREVDRLADDAWAVFRSPFRDVKPWKQRFREGAVAAIAWRLDEMRLTVETEAPAGALVLRSRVQTVTDLLVQAAEAAPTQNPWDGAAVDPNDLAFRRGVAAGSDIALQQAAPGRKELGDE